MLALCLAPFVLATPPPATQHPALAEAEKLYKKQLWVEAEDAFYSFAKKYSRSEKAPQALYKAGLCRLKMKDKEGAFTLFKKLTSSQILKEYPETASFAYRQIYFYYRERKMRPARERIISKCLKSLPKQPATAEICEHEGENRLLAGNSGKALHYYELADGGLSKIGTDILHLLKIPRSGLRTTPFFSEDIDRLATVAGKKPECALALCDLLSKRKDGWMALNAKADIYVHLERYDDALDLWKGMLRKKQGPSDRISLAMAETTGFKKGDFKSAVLMYEGWLKSHSDSESVEDAEYQQAGTLWMSGDYENAVIKFTAFLNKYPKSKYERHVHSSLARVTADRAARLKALAEREKVESSADLLADDLIDAESQMRRGAYSDALKILNRFRGKQSTHPNWGRAWYNYGVCRRFLGEPVKACACFEQVLRHARLFKSTVYAPQCRRALADLWFEDFAEAGKALPVYQEIRAGLPQGKTDQELDKNIALALMALGRGAEAKPMLLKFRQRELNDPVRIRYWDGLIALCDKPPESDGLKNKRENEARSYSRVADIHFAAENWKKAEYLYKKASKAVPKTETAAFAAMQTARCQAYQNQCDRALKTYKLFMTDYRDSQWADNALLKAGVLCTGPMGDSEKGVKYFRKVVNDYPKGDYAELAFYYLATLAHWGQNWKEAEQLHREFLKKYPESRFVKNILDNRLPAIARKKLHLEDHNEA